MKTLPLFILFALFSQLSFAQTQLGADIDGAVADLLGIEYAIVFIGILTLISSLIIKWRMQKKGQPLLPFKDRKSVV
jgi:hypothetical protein